ncbi:MAG: hypothetical protein M1820_008284 [Bogoriella megaspora]|nr:MAG: hypothetical protein M1820_008284 [Bogoriella megaspora]
MAAINAHRSKISQDDELVLWTDASYLFSGCSAAAIAMRKHRFAANSPWETHAYAMIRGFDNNAAETIGVIKAIEFAIDSLERHRCWVDASVSKPKVYIFTDSQACLTGLQNFNMRHIRSNPLLKVIALLAEELETAGVQVHFHWTKGHIRDLSLFKDNIIRARQNSSPGSIQQPLHVVGNYQAWARELGYNDPLIQSHPRAPIQPTQDEEVEEDPLWKLDAALKQEEAKSQVKEDMFSKLEAYANQLWPRRKEQQLSSTPESDSGGGGRRGGEGGMTNSEPV